jgi:hypothetical protein
MKPAALASELSFGRSEVVTKIQMKRCNRDPFGAKLRDAPFQGFVAKFLIINSLLFFRRLKIFSNLATRNTAAARLLLEQCALCGRRWGWGNSVRIWHAPATGA